MGRKKLEPVTPKVDAAETIYRVIKTNIVSVDDGNNGKALIVYITLDHAVPSMVKDDNGEYTKRGESDTIHFTYKRALGILHSLVDRFSLFAAKARLTAVYNEQACVVEAFNGAKLYFAITPYEIGDTYTDSEGNECIHQYAGYDYDILAIEVTDDVRNGLEDYTSNFVSILSH